VIAKPLANLGNDLLLGPTHPAAQISFDGRPVTTDSLARSVPFRPGGQINDFTKDIEPNLIPALQSGAGI
jgi:hypothetical protein